MCYSICCALSLNVINIKFLTYSPLLICRGAGDLRQLHYGTLCYECIMTC